MPPDWFWQIEAARQETDRRFIASFPGAHGATETALLLVLLRAPDLTLVSR